MLTHKACQKKYYTEIVIKIVYDTVSYIINQVANFIEIAAYMYTFSTNTV